MIDKDIFFGSECRRKGGRIDLVDSANGFFNFHEGLIK